jgi:hypothetical protein
MLGSIYVQIRSAAASMSSTPRIHIMTCRRILLTLLSGTIACTAASRPSAILESPDPGSHDHITWVGTVLARMQTIRPGMTRRALLRVFKTEGGVFQNSCTLGPNGDRCRLDRTFASRDCQYCKVDVEFEAVGLPIQDQYGRAVVKEDGRDIIVRMSRPYLEFMIID